MQAVLRSFLVSLLLVSLASAQTGVPERHFRFHYAFTVRNPNPGAPLRIWIPLAESGEFQNIKVVSQKGDLPLRQSREGEYGDEMLYAETPKTDKDEYSF